MPDDYRNPDSRREAGNRSKKNPSDATSKRFGYEKKIFKTPAPASTLFLSPLPSSPACCSRGQVTSYFANSEMETATAQPRLEPLK
jgi:hypothetical protein